MENIYALLFITTLFVLSGIFGEEQQSKQEHSQHDQEGHKKAPVHDTKHVHNKE